VPFTREHDQPRPITKRLGERTGLSDWSDPVLPAVEQKHSTLDRLGILQHGPGLIDGRRVWPRGNATQPKLILFRWCVAP
jgi:hypothetical protein